MPCLLYSAHPSLEQARASADALLSDGLAACCNILPAAESHYVWDGNREQSREIVMLSKTTQALAQTAIERLRTLHPYACPAILELPVSGGNQAFLAWVEETVKTTR